MRILIIPTPGGWYLHQRVHCGRGIYRDLPPVFLLERDSALRVIAVSS
jgi:hypothetical protein